MNIEILLDDAWKDRSLDLKVIGYNEKRALVSLFVYGRMYSLSDVVDESEQLDSPTLRVANLGSELIFWGGKNICLVSEKRQDSLEIAVPRDAGDLEHWRSMLLKLNEGLFFIFESCVVAVDKNFKKLWLSRIRYDLSYKGLSRDFLLLWDADSEPWKIHIKSGELTRGWGY